MILLSGIKLAKTVKSYRMKKGLTLEDLGTLTGISQMTIKRIEHGNFIPSISQFEALATELEFDIGDMFINNQENNSFDTLLSEALNDNEKAGLEKLFSMMLSLRQQLLLRRYYELEKTTD